MSTMTNGATITVIATGKSYHTLRDWGLAIGNNNCIGTPVQETFYLDVPGADGFLDYSEALTGRPIFKQRPIEIILGGKMDRRIWNSFISSIRILLHGKRVRIVFDDFPGYYWEGRAEVTEFDRVREIGTFKLSIPQADPYGYSLNDNSTQTGCGILLILNWVSLTIPFKLRSRQTALLLPVPSRTAQCPLWSAWWFLRLEKPG